MQPSDNLWQAVLGEIELAVSRGNYMTWFKPTQLLRCDDTSALIGVPNVFIKQQLERKYTALIAETLKKNGMNPEKIEYKIHTAASKKLVDEPVMRSDGQQSTAQSPAHLTSRGSGSGGRQSQDGGSGGGKGHTYRQGLNERYTFENFIVGSGNELAYAACQAIAASPGTKYNPLFLYGGVGIGKTHLIQAVGNAVLANKPDARVVYVSTEQFVQEFVDALRFKKNLISPSTYRSADVLIVDDVQFIAGKEKIQEEFFHTFNALHQANKQIIISSDKPPSDIPAWKSDCVSRFVWGMSIDMQIPDFETRCAILQTKAGSHDVELPSEVVEYLATNIQTNIRELEGALNQLLAFCEMRGLEPNLAIATGLLGASKTRPKAPQRQADHRAHRPPLPDHRR